MSDQSKKSAQNLESPGSIQENLANWKLVPVVPTEAMWGAMKDILYDSAFNEADDATRAYKAALQASPPPPDLIGAACDALDILEAYAQPGFYQDENALAVGNALTQALEALEKE